MIGGHGGRWGRKGGRGESLGEGTEVMVLSGGGGDDGGAVRTRVYCIISGGDGARVVSGGDKDAVFRVP